MQKIYVNVRMLTFYRPYTTLMQLSYLEIVVVKKALFFLQNTRKNCDIITLT